MSTWAKAVLHYVYWGDVSVTRSMVSFFRIRTVEACEVKYHVNYYFLNGFFMYSLRQVCIVDYARKKVINLTYL